MLALVPVPESERQPTACSTCTKHEEYRAHAAARFTHFKAKFGTAGVSDRQLRAVFAAHANPQLVETLLVFAWYLRLPAWRLREITKSLNPRRCSNTTRCWLHTREGTNANL